ncbi:hypothetical protein JJC03_09965 [Flavobacterium oreochromis]|uniref:hypothetical protein n=1 Tax=Flavobacterium oreochromis TaxID=2906078 RepID=UPI001CE5CBD0|nr:hypothetical protein [Flavobacterium oreochromis]QYS85538.1 hypothetical protein JJC03_09965 [Flavobacterium oreochromis]
MAKYGKRGAKVLRAADEAELAAHLEKQAENALEEIERRKTVTTPDKNAKFNPDQHSEFIDTERNLPGSKQSFSNPADKAIELKTEKTIPKEHLDGDLSKVAETNIKKEKIKTIGSAEDYITDVGLNTPKITPKELLNVNKWTKKRINFFKKMEN